MKAQDQAPPARTDTLATTTPPGTRRGHRRAAIIVVALLLAAFSSLLGFVLYGEYRRGEQQAFDESAKLAQAFEAHTRLTLGRLDGALRQLAADLQPTATAGPASAAAITEALQRRIPAEINVRVALLRPQIDTAGDYGPVDIVGPWPPAIGHPATSDVYLAHRRKPDLGLFVAGARIGLATGQWFVVVSRRVSDENGGFAGVLVASIPETSLRQFDRALNMGPLGWVALYRSDGLLLARDPFSPERLGMSAAQGPLFAAYLSRNSSGTFRTATSGGGIDRFVSYRRIAGLPIVVAVGIATSDALGGLLDHLWLYVLLWSGLVIATLGALFILLKGDAMRGDAEAARARALNRMRQVARRLRVTLDNLAEAVVTFDAGGRIVSANRSARRMFGASSRELKQRSIEHLVKPAEGSAAGPIAGMPATAGATREVTGTRSNGEAFPANMRVSGFELDGRQLHTASLTDLSGRREAERQMQISDSRFRAIFDSSLQYMTLLRPDGVMLEANAALLASAGVTREAIVGKPAWEAPWWRRDPKGVAWLREAIRKAAGGEPSRRLFAGVALTGRTTHIDFALKAIRNDEGQVSYLMVEARDLTDRVAAEEDMRQAQRLQAVGQLTSGVAHQFNNLLTVVLAGAETLAETLPPSSSEHRRAERIVQAAERGAALTHSLLAFSRKQPLQPRVIAVAALLSEVELLAGAMLPPGIELRIEKPDDMAMVSVDPTQLQSALLNLVSNARDAIGTNGRIAIAASLTALGNGEAKADGVVAGNYVAFDVSDDGSGMPPHVLARAYEPFFSTKAVGKGTGMGLSSVFGFAKQSGGHVTIDSAPDRGTTVRLLLPEAMPANAAQRPRLSLVGKAPQLLQAAPPH